MRWVVLVSYEIWALSNDRAETEQGNSQRRSSDGYIELDAARCFAYGLAGNGYGSTEQRSHSRSFALQKK